MARVPDEILNDQTANNRRSDDAWERYAPHRDRVTSMVLPERRAGRLCVLGAGNGNDLDLDGLSAWFEQIVLVDIDGEAVDRALQRAPAPIRPRLVKACPVDVSGAAAALAAWRPGHEGVDGVTRALQTAPETVLAELGGARSDVVLSACVLTQLIETCRRVIGATSDLPVIVGALWRSHLRVLAALASSGGRIVLVTDLVSSDTCEELATTASEDVEKLMVKLIAGQNFFTGTNPFLMVKTVREDPAYASLVCDVSRQPPWIWQQGVQRSYLVHALTYRRREDGGGP